jgi:hypothetical protein
MCHRGRPNGSPQFLACLIPQRSAGLEALAGYLNERGLPFNPNSIRLMLEG